MDFVSQAVGSTLYITGVQLEPGTVATPFEFRPYGTELALCQRYYYRFISPAAGSRYGTGFVTSTAVASVFVPFPNSMRTNPSIVETTGTAADYTIVHAATVTVCSAVPAMSGASAESANVTFTVSSGLTTGQGCMGRAAGTAGFLGFSAEL